MNRIAKPRLWGCRKPSLPCGLAVLQALTLCALLGSPPVLSAAESPTNPPPTHLLLTDSLGRVQRVSTNEVSPDLHPPESVGLGHQVPTTTKGAVQSEAVRRRIRESKTGEFWFPATPPNLMPYLANLDEYGNTAIQPGPVFDVQTLGKGIQAGKYGLSEVGLRYSFYQSLTMVSMTDVAAGSSALQYYTATFFGKWAIMENTNQGTAGWLSTEVNVQLGLSPASRTQSPQENLATIVNPLDTVFGPNGVWISELAWQQSLMDGRLVLLAGQVDQSNYLDANSYANNSQGQFLNSAFVNSSVLPFAFNNLGLNLQYQPGQNWYLLFGTGALNQAPGDSPFDDLSFDNWTYMAEFGLTPQDVLGLGPGAYRLQPFVATVDGVTQAGVGLNFQQQLGTNSPFAWFGRFGVGGSQLALNGADAQIASGLVLQAPLRYVGLFPKLSNDYFGAAFVWSHASPDMQPAARDPEYALEVAYVLQLTPLASLQTDLQTIWNPADHADAARNWVFQLQLNLTW